MKKVIFVAGVAVLALASVTSAAFMTNLTVGSTGADVTALQTWLITSGFSIPAIESGAANKGYFGSQTKAALAKYQASVGLPAFGFFGPLTQSRLNNGGQVVTTPVNATCPAGHTCTMNPGTVTPPSTGSNGVISTVGIPGTLAVTLWNSPSDGTTVYKGQSYDVVAYKAQAAASDMAIQSIGVDFNTRLWLYASVITIKDDQGKVVGQVSNLNSSNFSELTVGSNYRVTIPISNYVVKATQSRYLTVNITFLPTSDRTTGNIGVTAVQVRSVDGTGVTDTQSPLVATRTFSYQGSGAGSVVVTVNGASPLAGLVQISTGGQTADIPLAVYDIKAQNAASNLRSVTFTVYTSGTSKTPQDLFSQYSLKIGAPCVAQTVGAQTVTPNTTINGQASTTVTFTNFGIVTLPADTYCPVTLLVKAQQNTNNVLDGTIASTSLVVSGTAGGASNNPQVEDNSYSTLANNAGTFISSNLTFSGSSAVLSGLSASLGTPTVQSNTTTGYPVKFSFTVTAGNNTLYLSQNPAVALATTSTGFGSTASSSLPLAGVIVTPPNGSDTSPVAVGGYYVVPAGTARQFTFEGSINNTNGATSFKTFTITQVNYGTTTSALTAANINYNLQALKVTANF